MALGNEILHLALEPGAKLDEMGLVRIERSDAASAERLAREHTNTFRQRPKDFLSDSPAPEVRLGRQIR